MYFEQYNYYETEKVPDRVALSRETHLITSSLHFIRDRLQAVPFWIVERSCEIAEREMGDGGGGGGGFGERREKGESLFSFISPRSSLAAL